MGWERTFVRIQAAALIIALLTAATWGPQRVLEFLAKAGAPLPGETIPRQLPYRGYLEQNGVPVQNPALELGFALFPSDGGTPWRTVLTTGVANGHFSVDLGDVAPIPAPLLDDPGVALGVQVQPSLNGPVLAGTQRLLSVPFSQRAALARASIDATNASNATGALATQLTTMAAQSHQFFASAPPTVGVRHTDGAGVPWTRIDPMNGLTFTPVVSGIYRFSGMVFVFGRNQTLSQLRLNVVASSGPNPVVVWQPTTYTFHAGSEQENLQVTSYFRLTAGVAYAAFPEYSNNNAVLHTDGVDSLTGQDGIVVAELVSVP